MTAILLSDCTVHRKSEGDVEEVYVITPATADSANTIDMANVVNGRTIVNVEGYDQTTGDNVTATNSSGTITIDAAGGTTNHTYTVKLALLR